MRVSMTEPCPQPSPSMKVPPKRKGNDYLQVMKRETLTLNESPSEKEGKSLLLSVSRIS